jgi:hypothetical protein
LQTKRRQSFHLGGVGDLDLPAMQLELVVDETGAGHRLDRRPHRLTEAADPAGQATQTIRIGRRRTHLNRLTRLIEQVKVETLATEIQSGVQHTRGLPSSLEDARSMTPREALLHRIPSPQSV